MLNEELEIVIFSYYILLLVKFVAAFCLHLMLYPEIARMLHLMKYITNHNEYFTHPNIAFAVTLFSLMTNISTELVNCYLLLY